MTVKKKENQTKAQPDEPAAGSLSSELREPIWSVISFEKSEAGGLTYAAAERKRADLEAQNISGLCIITDEAAARIGIKK